MSRSRKLSKSLKYLLILICLVVAADLGIKWQSRHQSNSPPQTSFNKRLYSIDDPASIWAIVNKGRALPKDYVPSNLVVPAMPLRLPSSDSEMLLRQEAAQALERLNGAAAQQNIHLMLASGYRSYDEQAQVYTVEVKAYGQTAADSESARPGHSEHQTGLAADIEPVSRQCEVQPCFAQTPEGQWLATNAFKYGFILRYKVDQEKLTGYRYEPWHIRYVGLDLANQIQKTNQALEQFFNLTTFRTYPHQVYTLKSN